ncbi:MAG: McrC family protein [Prevotellaceae bacterium]|jgi:5-methylcytosine-specific restriction endonuclease McrBC regulatory subunit McrC|nr:McrC family protein [Prevotellaceae bacterium]
MRTTDNNGGKHLTVLQREDNPASLAAIAEDLQAMANKNLRDLQRENPDLLVFPQSLGQYHDDIDKLPVFSLHEDMLLTTCNLMGFIGRNNTQLTIASRFSQEGEDSDYFLHYMLQKVFAVNIFKFDQTPSKENIWDFLLYLFPYYLKKAYSQGLYKAYRREEYNDANVKGAIDVKRHIRANIPFAGKIAYITREHSYDNYVTQLIRHTIEHIKVHPWGSGILTNDGEVRDIAGRICFITQSSYKKNDRQKVINANLKPVTHPYFTEYKMLQKICLRILRREKLTFGQEKDKIYGLLFDGAWLWEEYLNTILKDDFIHPENKTGKHRQYLFDNFQPIYPDFISRKENPKLVCDAKYTPLEKQKEYGENSERATSIYYKTIAYMYRFKSDSGFLLFPHEETNINERYTIKGTNGKLTKLGLKIPRAAGSYSLFKDDIAQSEQAFAQYLGSSS